MDTMAARTMKRRTLSATMAAGIAAATAMCMATTTNVWIGGTAPSGERDMEAAYNFAQADNWDPPGMPNGSDVYVDITSLGTPFITNIYPVTVEKLKGSSAWYISDETFTHAGHGVRTEGMNFCCPFVLPASTTAYVGGVGFFGPVTCPSGSMLVAHSGGNVTFYDNYWSDVSGGTRTFNKINSLLQYRSAVVFTGPKGRTAADSPRGWYFYLTEGSRFAKTKSGYSVTATWVVGAPLTSTTESVIKPGTFVKRMFTSLWMELSEPATATGLFWLNFDNVEVHARREIGTFGHNGSTDHDFEFIINKYRDEDEYAVEVDKFAIYPLDAGTKLRRTTIGTSSSAWKPGRFVIHEQNTVNVNGVRTSAAFRLGTCDILFSSSPNAAGPGLPYALVDQPTATAESQLSVTGEMQAVVQQLYDLKGTITKAGSGTLLVGMTNSVGNTGSIVVKEGTFGVNDDAEADIAQIGRLSVAAGATLRVPVQGFRATTSFSIEPGAALAGTGRLYVPARVKLTGVDIAPGVEVVIGGGETSLPTGLPVPAVPGNPAFWVDFSQTNKMTLVEIAGGGIGIERIDDVRSTGAGDGYIFATNVAKDTYWPLLKYNADKDLHYAYFAGRGAGVTANPDRKIGLTDELVWSKPVTYIREAFQVYGCNGGPGPFLGHSSRARIVDAGGIDSDSFVFGRYSTAEAYFSWQPDKLLANATFRVNNRPVAMTVEKPPYTTTVDTGYFMPMVAAMSILDWPSGGKPTADSFFFNPAYSDQNATALVKKPLGELIVYTNVLTEVERLQVTRYLMRKWLATDVSEQPYRFSDTLGTVSGGTINVPAGSVSQVDYISPGVTFGKTGDGTLYVDKAYAPGSVLVVSGGTMRVRSRDMAQAPAFTADDALFAHYDASSLDNFDYSYDAERGVKTVTRWHDIKNGGTERPAFLFHDDSTNRPFIAENALNGLSVLDFGPFYSNAHNSEAAKKSDSGMNIVQKKGHRTVLAVWGSANGGGNLLGAFYTYWNNGYGISRGGTHGGLAADAISRGDSYLLLSTPGTYAFNLNGVGCNPTAQGLSGGYDIVSFSTLSGFGVEGLMFTTDGTTDFTGGGQLAEMMIFDNALPSNRVCEIEAYLRKKWFGADTPGFRPATLGRLVVADGATLVVEGGAALTVSTLVCGGTIQGDVVTASGATLEVAVAADGSTTPVAITGSFDMSRGGTVRFTGTPAALRAGHHVLVTGANIQSLAGWSVDTSTLRPGWSAVLKLVDGDLHISYANGIVINFR